MSILDRKFQQTLNNNISASANASDIKLISIDKLVRSDANDFPICLVEELAETIKESGLLHNLVVRPIEAGMFEIISGERRSLALNNLVEKGYKEFELVPCKVVAKDDFEANISLIRANTQTRQMSPGILLNNTGKLEKLYKEKKKDGEKIDVRKKIASDLMLSDSMVGRYQQINKNLIDEIKELAITDKITIEGAHELCKLDEDQQREVFKELDSLDKESIGISDIDILLKSKFIEDDIYEEDQDEKQLEIYDFEEITPSKNTYDSFDEVEYVEDDFNDNYDVEDDKDENEENEICNTVDNPIHGLIDGQESFKQGIRHLLILKLKLEDAGYDLSADKLLKILDSISILINPLLKD